MKIISELSASCDISEIFSVKKVIKLLQKNLDGMKKVVPLHSLWKTGG